MVQLSFGPGPEGPLPHGRRHRQGHRRSLLRPRARKTLGIVGESGSGKSVSSSAILGPAPQVQCHGRGPDPARRRRPAELTDEEMRMRRGKEVAMIFQDPLSAMHPYYTVGNQIGEAYRVHNKVTKKAARAARHRDARPGRDPAAGPPRRRLPAPVLRRHAAAGDDRHGADQQPGLLIADEPTTALDVTVQAQILDLLQDLQREFDSAIIIITHDLGVVAEMADDVLVMYAGRAVEYGRCKEILTHPEMPYTWGLLSSVPDVRGDINAKLIPIPGNPPSLLNPPPGCVFHPRCTHRDKVPGDLCRTPLPELLPGRQRRTATSSAATSPTPMRSTDRDPPRDRARPGRGEVMDRHRRPTRPPRPLRRRAASHRRPGRGDPDPPRAVTTEDTEADPDGREPQDVLPGEVVGGAAPDGRSRPGGRRRLVPGAQGGSLGLVGESGCGKSTTGRLITRLYEPTGGSDRVRRARHRARCRSRSSSRCAARSR